MRRITEVEALLTTSEEQGELPAAKVHRQLDYLERLLRTRTNPEAASLQSRKSGSKYMKNKAMLPKGKCVHIRRQFFRTQAQRSSCEHGMHSLLNFQLL